MSYDVLIRGGTLMPGDGEGFLSDMAIKEGRIFAIGSHLPPSQAAMVIDATHHWVCPGFIDLHAHSALEPFHRPNLAPKIAQGFTTEVIHPDGLAPAPVHPTQRVNRQLYLQGLEGIGPVQWTWTSLEEFLRVLHSTHPATTLVPSIGHNAIRDFVMGSGNRRPSPEEILAMRRQISMAAEWGARMFSLGLIYLPGVYSDAEELTVLAEEAARWNIPLMPHIRNEAALVLEAVREMVDLCRKTGASLHISHLKIVGHADLADPLLALVDRAGDAMELTFDQYPYGAGSTVLTALLPPWALTGGATAILARLHDRDLRHRMTRDMMQGIPGWENLYHACGADNIVIAHAETEAEDVIGHSLAEIGRKRQESPWDAALDLLAECRLNVTMVDHYATEETVRKIFRHPKALVGTDGIFGTHPHPRLFGTAARVLGRYAIRERLISPVQAIHRLTAGAADRLRLTDRGRLREGLRADLVVLDPREYLDIATYEEPVRYPSGVSHVLVNGVLVWENGHSTGARPGGVLGF